MKILITTDAYTNMINGVAVSVHNLYTALKASGQDVRILTLSSDNTSYQEGDVYYIRSTALKIYPDIRATLSFHDPFLRDILAWEPEVIHSQSEFFTFIYAKKIARKLNIPIVHTYHTLYEYYTHYFCPSEAIGRKIVALGSRFICNRVDAVIAPTEKTARILEGYEVDSPIGIIPTGLSLERLQKSVASETIQELRAQLHIPENAPVIVTLGRLAREKNVDFLIKQMTDARLQKVHFVIVGDGPDRERLEGLVSELGLQETVHFTGMVAPEEVSKYYRLGDVFVSASSSETQGLTYIEAMACDLPLFCLKDLCLQSILRPGYNGYFFKDSEEFVQHLMELIQMPSQIMAMKQHALETASDFSKEAFARKALQFYIKTITDKEENRLCNRFACIPKLIWRKVTGY